MALMKCPECELQVSDKALACPHCGYPLQEKASVRKAYKRPNKRRKLPNGFGSITEIKNKNLRKPFLARICVGKTPLMKPLLKPLGYFESYEDAYQALLDYNKNPYDLDSESITMAELYEKWGNGYFPTLASDSSVRTVTSAWSYCSSIYTMRVKDVRTRHLKGCMEDGYRIGTKGKEKDKKIFPSAGTKARMKSVFNLMFDYAMEYELTDKNYARMFEVSDSIITEKERTKRDHFPFSRAEMQMLWNNVDTVRFVDWILIQCYMGWRPQELALLLLTEVNLDEWYICGGMKTDAGKQRIVPIHTDIRELVKRNYEYAVSIGSDRLINDTDALRGGFRITYDKYANRFTKVMEALHINPEHRPHDPRTTFITMAKKSGMDEYALKRVVGHKIEDITESTYTKRDIEWLRADIEKIKSDVLI